MAGKTKKAAVVAKFPAPDDKASADAMAVLALRPSVNAAAVIAEYGRPFGELDLGALTDSIAESVEQVWSGDMARCESMLIGQAQALQSIFMNLSRRAIKQEYLKNCETFLRLALKAQSQCRATLETLAAIKNPPIVYARQANVTTGPQQINNGMAAPSQAGKNEIEPSKLLEAQHGNYLDTSKAGAAGGADSQLATVGEVDRAEVGGR